MSTFVFRPLITPASRVPACPFWDLGRRCSLCAIIARGLAHPIEARTSRSRERIPFTFDMVLFARLQTCVSGNDLSLDGEDWSI